MMLHVKSNSHLLFITLLVLLKFKQFSCGCDSAYMTICENIADFREEYDGTWTHVIIEPQNPDEHTAKDKFNFLDFNKLTSLVIINQINEISRVPHTTYTTNMKFLSFYENKLKLLKKHSFPGKLQLDKLVLVNNEIERIEAETFVTPQIENIDLSYNSIEVILLNTFTNKDSKNFTKVINLQYNELIQIEPNSFPSSLIILKLNNNNLRSLQSGVIGNLVNLRGLFMSHNMLYSVPNIKELRSLNTLDLSHNVIDSIEEDMFENLENLEILDLSNNTIKRVGFLKPLLLTNRKYLQMSLAFNRLHTLDFGIGPDATLTENKSFLLYGNPWWCHKWTFIQKYLTENKMEQTACDLKHFNSGKAPFCISFQGKPNYFPNSSAPVSYVIRDEDGGEASEDEIENFLFAISRTKEMIDCKLTVKKNTHILYEQRTQYDEGGVGLLKDSDI